MQATLEEPVGLPTKPSQREVRDCRSRKPVLADGRGDHRSQGKAYLWNAVLILILLWLLSSSVPE